MTGASFRIGLISDTHGLLRPQALAALHGSDHIIHAGDIGDPAILPALAAIAPVTAVRGNNDRAAWAASINEVEYPCLAGIRMYIVHDVADMDIDPVAAGVQVVIAGHSHRPKAEMRDGVLFINPGSAGPRRFKLPVSVGRLVISNQQITPQLIELQIS